MKQLLVLSGKGGTGKTTFVSAFIKLADAHAYADCDVDAADMHLLLHPGIRKSEDFSGGRYAVIDHARCIGCGKCLEVCRFEAITPALKTDVFSCEGCGLCSSGCPRRIIQLGW